MNKQDIEKLALLSRLRVSEKEIEAYAKDFDAILSYIESIQAVDLSAYSAENSKNSRVIHNVMREDENPYEAGSFTDAIIKQAPKSDKGYVRVNKIL
jgi:aspartyl-tRNA(Asn)/glutamyl-tRNA(Gln) amidotransferase subunit C